MTLTTDDLDHAIRRRPASLAYKLKVEAVGAVGSLSGQLSAWSQRVAYLRGIAQRLTLKEETRSSAIAETRELLIAVQDQRADFSDRIKALPPDVASHSRIADAERALDFIEKTLTETLAALTR